ncbi:MAG TPA: SurA N-terminal domain-containing protein [Terriglobales bacterium]|nr:SurA N-terminal domain-containing protein [Terriglobales bacterium]
MLKTMRKNVKSLKWILWIIVATFVVSIFFIWGGAGRLGEGGGGNTLAMVGREKISGDEYTRDLRQRLDAMKKQFPGLNENLIQQLNIPQQTLEQLIQQRLLLQIAREKGIRATDDEVRAKIVSYPVFQRDGKFVGFDAYKRVLNYYHIPLKDFEEGLRQEVVMSKTVGYLTAGIIVTEDEVWDGYRKQNDSAKIEYVVAEASKVEVKDKPTEAEVQARFAKAPGAYKVPEKRLAEYVFLKTDDAKKDVKVTPAEVEKYYKDNLAQFREPERLRLSRIWLPFTAKDKEAVLAQARDILKKAQAGADFAVLARTFSKDDKAKSGGDWGLTDWRSLSAKETEAAARLAAGRVSDVVETDTGAAILKATEKAPAATKALAEVSATIKGILEDQKARAIVSDRIGRLEKLARKEKSLDVAAQKEGLKVSATGALRKGAPLGDFDSAGAVSDALFGLKEKAISAPIYTYTGAGLAQLQKVEPERPAKLEEVRDEVEKTILDGWKKERALATLRELRTKLKDDWAVEAGKLKLEYKTVAEHKREQYLSLVGDDPAVDALVFSLPLKQVSDPVPVEDGYGLFRVLERKETTRADFDKVKATERETLLEQKRNKFLQSVLAQAREERKVRVNYDLFVKLNSQVISRYAGE